MIDRHQELKAEVIDKEEKLHKLQALGRRVLPSVKNPEEIHEKLDEMSHEIAQLKDSWEERHKQLKQSSVLQVRNRQYQNITTGLYIVLDLFA